MTNKILFTEQVAKVCHNVNRAYCQSIGDDTQPTWKDAPDWQKQSAVSGVDFHMSNDTTPEQSHENWMKDKEADGWVFGNEKNLKRKEHPCMVPYGKLPKEQQTKDLLFKSVVDSFKK